MEATFRAQYMSNRLPLSVRVRLIRDKEFGEKLGLTVRPVVMIAGIGPFEQRELVAGARRALAGEGVQRIKDLEGHEVLLEVSQGTVIVKLVLDKFPLVEVRLDALMMLSSNVEERTLAFRDFSDLLGPTAPDFSGLRQTAIDRELTDEEIGELLTASATGIVEIQKGAASAVEADQVSFDNLVPDSLAYFELFCGPNPGNTELEAYLGSVLPAYRKVLLGRDVTRGLDICLCSGGVRRAPRGDRCFVCSDAVIGDGDRRTLAVIGVVIGRCSGW